MLILFLIISISIILLFKNKEKFSSVNDIIPDIKNIREARRKLNLTVTNKIEKGEKGIKGDDGDNGNIGKEGDEGKKGKVGVNGKNGIESGPIIFQTKDEKKYLGRYQPKGNAAMNIKTFVNVPKGVKGEVGEVGPIKYIVENKNTRGTFNFNLENTDYNFPLKFFNDEEIIGSYDPPNNSYASKQKSIIVTVPKGLKGERGDSGNCSSCRRGIQGNQGTDGKQGDKGERGEPGEDGEEGLKGGEENISIYNNVKINNKICFGPDANNMCLNNELLNIIIEDLNDKYNKIGYIPPLKRREERLKKEICRTNDIKKKDELELELLETLQITNPNTERELFNSDKCNSILN